MDFLRSCYSTNVVMTQDGHSFNVKWYFGELGDPIHPRHVFGSLNWSRPHYGSGLVGEVIGAPRPWRDGSIPPEATLFGVPLGEESWYVKGAPTQRTEPSDITFFGSRVEQQGPGGEPAGLFPLILLPPRPLTLSSSVSGNLLNVGGFFAYQWTLAARFPGVSFGWGNPGGPFWNCWPNKAPLTWTHPADATGFYFRAVSYDRTTGISVWDDPFGTLLNPGETLTLHGFPS